MNRRNFFKSLGLSFSLPALETFGAQNEDIKRLGVVYVPNGINMKHWTPSDYGKIKEIPQILSPLERHLDKFQVISGLTHDKARPHGDGAGDHARACATFLTGKQANKSEGKIFAGKSFDQILAKKYNGVTKYDSLQFSGDKSVLSGKCDSGYSCAYQYSLSWLSPTQPLPSMNDPREIFNRLFKVEEVSKKKYIQRKSILDFILEDAKRLNSKVSNTDKQKLDEYFYAVREAEIQLENIDKFNIENNFELDFDVEKKSDNIRLMYKLMHLSYLTDTSRVITYLTAHEGDNKPYKEIDVSEGHHSLSHHQNDASKLEDLAKINHYHVNLFSEFIDLMKKDNLLDNTTIIYGGGISDGNRHNHDELPCLLVGGKNSGTHTRVEKEKPMCDLFVSIMQKHDIDIHKFGDSESELNVV